MRKDIINDPQRKYKGKMPNIIYSDRGLQYRSFSYQDILNKNNICHSMSDPGTPVDNVVVESYCRSIKRELIIPNKHKLTDEMKVLIKDFLTGYYVNKRIHTKLKMTPRKYEEKLLCVI